jgi:mono/diheme cytochrome c family protein
MRRIAGISVASSLVSGAALVLVFAGLGSVAAGTAAPQGPARIDYDRQVKPLLEKNCLECHSQDKRKGGLSLATYDDILDGGKDGPVVRPGHGATSMLLARVSGDRDGDRMPKDGDPLRAAEIARLRQWIDQGARLTPTSPAAPQPWEATLALATPVIPAIKWPAWSRPLDRLVASYLSNQGVPQPALVADAAFARRAYLDIWGLLPSPDRVQAFTADPAPDKRDRLVATLLADDKKYAEHWISFWNDLLRNEDGQTYFSEQNGRKSITSWLTSALADNMPYDRFVGKLLNPTEPGDPEGFLTGVNWRGETSAAVTPWMQASQNTAQAFLGVNFKCNACHNSFVSKWKLKDAYGLAAYFSPEPRLQLYRCDIARDEFAAAEFFYPELRRAAPSSSLADRRATAAAIFVDPRNGRMPRTVVNRLWTRLLGRGIVVNSDEMDGQPWSPDVLDWLAGDFVAHQYDLKHLVATIVTSRAYQMPAVSRSGEAPARAYVFRGPEVRRLTAEQFADAIGTITGEWSVGPSRPGAGGGRAAATPRTDSDPATSGSYVRDFRAGSSQLTRALGRPIRDQVTSVRASDATTLQALELVNGEMLTRWLMRGARRLVGALPPEPLSLFNASTGGRNATGRMFDADISRAAKLWLIVSDTGSNAPERVLPVFVKGELVGPEGAVPLSSLTPVDGSGLRSAAHTADRLPVKSSSRLVYDITGRGFTRFRGTFDLDNDRAEIGSTLNPSVRFFVFDAAPNMERLLPTAHDASLPAPAPLTTTRAVVDWIFWSALGRAPSAAEYQMASAASADPARPGHPSADGVADLLWALLMTPEFQLIF